LLVSPLDMRQEMEISLEFLTLTEAEKALDY
jgi:hypothetical protein